MKCCDKAKLLQTHTHTHRSVRHTTHSLLNHMSRGPVLFYCSVLLQHCENLTGHSLCISALEYVPICAERHELMFVNRTILLFFFFFKSASVHLPAGVCACFCVCVRIIRRVSEVTEFCYKGPQPKVFLSTSSLCKGHVWSALCCITMDRREGEQGRGR